MKIKQREAGDVSILEISGEMYGGPENQKLLELATEIAGNGGRKLLLNLEKVKWIASTGLGILVTTKTRFEREGGRIAMCRLNERVLTLFQVTKLVTMMEVYDSEDEALKALAK
ncbi:MAG: STAS domain-containing protein [bacterium]